VERQKQAILYHSPDLAPTQACVFPLFIDIIPRDLSSQSDLDRGHNDSGHESSRIPVCEAFFPGQVLRDLSPLTQHQGWGQRNPLIPPFLSWSRKS
jgi:hypothetical protein